MADKEAAMVVLEKWDYLRPRISKWTRTLTDLFQGIPPAGKKKKKKKKKNFSKPYGTSKLREDLMTITIRLPPKFYGLLKIHKQGTFQAHYF